VDDIHRKLYAEEKRYERLLHEIKDEEVKLGQERAEFKTLDEKEASLTTRLQALKDVITSIDAELAPPPSPSRAKRAGSPDYMRSQRQLRRNIPAEEDGGD